MCFVVNLPDILLIYFCQNLNLSYQGVTLQKLFLGRVSAVMVQ